MKIHRALLSCLLSAWLILLSSSSDAEDAPPQTYGQQVGDKFARAFGNLASAWLEIPKNMINTANDNNVILGSIGGLFKGIINTGGRIGAAASDLISFPLPTQPIAQPVYVWDDFDKDTAYGPAFRLPAENK